MTVFLLHNSLSGTAKMTSEKQRSTQTINDVSKTDCKHENPITYFIVALTDFPNGRVQEFPLVFGFRCTNGFPSVYRLPCVVCVVFRACHCTGSTWHIQLFFFFFPSMVVVSVSISFFFILYFFFLYMYICFFDFIPGQSLNCVKLLELHKNDFNENKITEQQH